MALCQFFTSIVNFFALRKYSQVSNIHQVLAFISTAHLRNGNNCTCFRQQFKDNLLHEEQRRIFQLELTKANFL